LLAAAPWIDGVAILPFVVLVLAAPDPLDAVGRLDPFIFFRLFVLLWVVAHIVILVRRFHADIRSLGEGLTAADRRLNLNGKVGRTGRRVMLWSVWRVAGLAVRYGWPTLLIILVVVAVNVATMLVLAGSL
jgi:hypothetical protein